VVTGQVSNNTSIDGVPLGTGEGDGYVVAFDPEGKVEWTRAFGDPANHNDTGSSIAIATDGSIVLGGETYDPPFGAPAITLKGFRNPFVAVLEPDGSPRWARGFGTSGSATLASVAASGHGSAFLAGWFTEEIEGTGARLKSAGLEDIFLYHVKAP
jgi:hypothetical protein